VFIFDSQVFICSFGKLEVNKKYIIHANLISRTLLVQWRVGMAICFAVFFLILVSKGVIQVSLHAWM